MKSLLTIATSTLLLMGVSGCGGGGDGDRGDVAGEINATLDGNTYTLPARCSEYEGEINVSSIDDGSGVEIDARQMGDKLNLDVVVGEKEYSTPNLGSWERTDQGLRGSGKLSLEGADVYREDAVSFEAACG